jgi:dihydroneopterin aldolase
LTGSRVENSFPRVPSPLRRTTEIVLAGMRFHVLVGVLPHERSIPQPLEVDLRVRLAGADGAVLDYRDLHGLVTAAVTGGPREYLEQVADDVLTRTLALPGVAWARVAVRKPHVALPGPLAYAEVSVEGAND